MPIIKPISDLRNKAREISKLAHQTNDPIFITRNGEGDMVVMSIAQYGRLMAKLDLLAKLSVAQAQKADGDKGRPYRDVIRDLRRRLRET